MNIHPIGPLHILLAFLPFVIFFSILVNWSMNWKEFLWAALRMIVQLVGVGYLLTFIFEKNHSLWTGSIVAFMMIMAGWIALRSVKNQRISLYKNALIALLCGSTPILLWTTGVVLPGASLSNPTFLIPLAGMVYSNAMNTLGIAAERFESERKQTTSQQALKKAFNASLISHLNMLMAVGIVSLPGLMSGQILSGVDPLLAVRYQMVVMLMVLNSSGLSSAIYLFLTKRALS